MDIEFLNENDDFELLPQSYVIFITEKDVSGDGRPMHLYERIDTDTGKPFCDGQHILYINGAYVGNEAIGQLMHDFRCASPDEMIIPEIAERTRYLKETPEGVEIMCQLMEERMTRKAEELARRLIARGKETL